MTLSARPDQEEAVKIARVLLRHGARVDTRDTSGPGCTALWMSAQNGSAKLLKFLIDQGASIDITPLNSQNRLSMLQLSMDMLIVLLFLLRRLSTRARPYSRRQVCKGGRLPMLASNETIPKLLGSWPRLEQT
jgi:hypothetical protein